jgi:hypothetical protein
VSSGLRSKRFYEKSEENGERESIPKDYSIPFHNVRVLEEEEEKKTKKINKKDRQKEKE